MFLSNIFSILLPVMSNYQKLILRIIIFGKFPSKVCAHIRFAHRQCSKADFPAASCISLEEILVKYGISNKFPGKQKKEKYKHSPLLLVFS